MQIKVIGVNDGSLTKLWRREILSEVWVEVWKHSGSTKTREGFQRNHWHELMSLELEIGLKLMGLLRSSLRGVTEDCRQGGKEQWKLFQPRPWESERQNCKFTLPVVFRMNFLSPKFNLTVIIHGIGPFFFTDASVRLFPQVKYFVHYQSVVWTHPVNWVSSVSFLTS